MSEIIDHAPEEPLAELFARDPGQLSEQDLDTIIAKLRAQRHRFKAGDKTAGKAKQSKASEKQSAAMKIGGDDLLSGLDL